MPSTVLIITNEYDLHVQTVMLELNKRHVPVFRFHPQNFPHACSISIEIQDGEIAGEIATPSRTVALRDISAVWYRRPRRRSPETGSVPSTKLDDYIQQQSVATIKTLCRSLQTLWVGDPYKLQRAEIKALQLAEASRAGLKTPHTLISNQPTTAATFIDRLGETACAIKPLNPSRVKHEEEYRVPFTTILPKGHPLDTVALAPNIFQPYVPKAAELRCVVIGKKIFSVKINSQANTSTGLDWRAGECRLEPFCLPEQVEGSLLRLMDSFGINFASLDMILTPEGEFVFLDLNPDGQWLWLELELGLPLAASMADLLRQNGQTMK
jgi:glutathione synthase/RimK-type ligase-like ATP-grasp enzyme